jgi:hypothetical protein
MGKFSEHRTELPPDGGRNAEDGVPYGTFAREAV